MFGGELGQEVGRVVLVGERGCILTVVRSLLQASRLSGPHDEGDEGVLLSSWGSGGDE